MSPFERCDNSTVREEVERHLEGRRAALRDGGDNWGGQSRGVAAGRLKSGSVWTLKRFSGGLFSEACTVYEHLESIEKLV